MSDFLKLAYELIAKVIYNIAQWIAAIVKGFLSVFVTGWSSYILIFNSYFPSLPFAAKILAIILVIILIAIPVFLIVLLVRRIILDIRLKADGEDSVVLYREIGRLNKQVLELMDEKNKILALKVGGKASEGLNYIGGDALLANDAEGIAGVGGTAVAAIGSGAIVGEAGPADPFADPAMAVAGGVAAGGSSAVLQGSTMVGNLNANAEIGGDAIANAAAAAASAAAEAKSKADEAERNTVIRFPKLQKVDLKYESFEEPVYNMSISLEDFAEGFRRFASSQLHLYYTPEVIRRFVAGMSSSHILILEGISGTGKTSLPYAFSRYLDNPATIVSVQPSYRDRTELLGYFNEFSKKFNETEFLRALYEANYRKDPSFIVLDEMNLARIEYYFAEMLSVLEMPSVEEWVVDLVPTAWAGDPELMTEGKINVSPNTWFVGTANNDDSTFTITDKVYDRSIPIELNQRAEAFECELEPRCCVTCDHLRELFEKAKNDHPITEASLAKLIKMDHYLQTRFKLAFGNRIMKQMYDFIPVYVACGGTELGGLDYIIARKVLKKFESMNVMFVHDEIKNLLLYMEKIFGKDTMPDCFEYLTRIQNLY